MSNQEKVKQRISELSQKKRKEMTCSERVQLLQLKLYYKAKREKNYKFYILYDKIFLGYILEASYKKVRRKGGSPGIDGQSFKDIEAYGAEQFLQELQEELRKRTYKPQAVRRKMIEKENGGLRPLGIPTIKDRVAQAACKMIIEPIFEADFDNSSHGYRPNHSPQMAIKEVKHNLKEGKSVVYDADLSNYFDTIPHDKLEMVLRERISDPRVINLIKLWLKVPIVEEDGRYTGGKKNGKGIPQGGVISPLLSNIYLNLLDRIVNNPQGTYKKRGIHMIRYADDFILMAKHIDQEVIIAIHSLLKRMGLIVNEQKSTLIRATSTPFNFLGFIIRHDISIFNRKKRYWNINPKPESQKKIRQRINAKLKKIGHYPAQAVVKELNPIIRGWMNYYRIEKVSYTQVAFKKLEDYLRERIFRYYNRKSQRKSNLHGQQAYKILTNRYGLIKPYETSGTRPVFAL